MSLNPEQIKDRIKQIPPLPQTTLEVMQVLDKPTIDITEIEQKIAKDPVLVGRVIAVANSSFYGFSGKVSSIKEACLVLGFHTIRNMVISLAVMQRLASDKQHNLDHIGLWQHSIGTGVAARFLARSLYEEEEAAFTTGLLHDIGKIVLDIYFADEYAEVITYRDTEDCLLYEAEEAVLGCNHCAAGSLIAQRWGLPENIIVTIGNHHAPMQAEATKLTRIVYLADIICRGLDIGDGGDTLIPVLEKEVLQSLEIDMAAIKSCLPEIMENNALSNILLD